MGCTEVKDRANASQIPNVVEARASESRNLIGKGEMGIKDGSPEKFQGCWASHLGLGMSDP